MNVSDERSDARIDGIDLPDIRSDYLVGLADTLDLMHEADAAKCVRAVPAMRELAASWEKRADVLHGNSLRARKAGDLNGSAALANMCSEARKCAKELRAIVGADAGGGR